MDVSGAEDILTTIKLYLARYGLQFLGALVILIAGLFIAGLVARATLSLCERHKLDITLSRFIANVARILVMAFVILMAMSKMGISITPLVAAASAIAFGSTLAIQGTLSNFGAGVSIILGRPFVIGNTITVHGYSGIVEEVKLSVTRLRNEDGETILIPNKRVVEDVIVNSYANRVVEQELGLSYGQDPERAVDVILQTLRGFAGVAEDPAPQVGIASFGESSFQIGLRYWAPTRSYFQTLYAVNRAIYLALAAAGMNIAHPRHEVHVVTQEEPH
jgi:small conductance mechanosensitive channel